MNTYIEYGLTTIVIVIIIIIIIIIYSILCWISYYNIPINELVPHLSHILACNETREMIKFNSGSK